MDTKIENTTINTLGAINTNSQQQSNSIQQNNNNNNDMKDVVNPVNNNLNINNKIDTQIGDNSMTQKSDTHFQINTIKDNEANNNSSNPNPNPNPINNNNDNPQDVINNLNNDLMNNATDSHMIAEEPKPEPKVYSNNPINSIMT